MKNTTAPLQFNEIINIATEGWSRNSEKGCTPAQYFFHKKLELHIGS